MMFVGSFIIGCIGGLVIPIYDFATKTVSLKNLLIQCLLIALWNILLFAVRKTGGNT